MEPIFYQNPPRDFPEYPKLTYDEFLPYEDTVAVTKTRHKTKESHPAKVLEAAKSMRLKFNEVYSYTISLSCDQDLNRAFLLPQEVAKVDLYSNYWPFMQGSDYFKLRSKLFHGYPRGYKSSHGTRYAGQSEWLYIITGHLKVVLIRPTEHNLARVSSECETEFLPETGTQVEYLMPEGSFMIIPGGWISQRGSPRKNTFVIGGEYLHCKDFTNQLRCFERDVITTNGVNAIRIDLEIRSLYWLSVAKMLDHQRAILDSLDTKDLEFLKFTLSEWKKKFRLQTAPPNLYGPIGLNLVLIVDDLRRHICSRSNKSVYTRKLLKHKKDLINVLMDQTSAYNQTN